MLPRPRRHRGSPARPPAPRRSRSTGRRRATTCVCRSTGWSVAGGRLHGLHPRSRLRPERVCGHRVVAIDGLPLPNPSRRLRRHPEPIIGNRMRDHSGAVSLPGASGRCRQERHPPSAIVSETTQAAPHTRLSSAPTGLTATAASPSQVNLASTRSIDNVGVPRYRVAPTSRCGLPPVRRLT
jgi:hypothetical protein